MVEDMAQRAADGDEESQLLITDEEVKEVNRQVSGRTRISETVMKLFFRRGKWRSEHEEPSRQRALTTGRVRGRPSWNRSGWSENGSSKRRR